MAATEIIDKGILLIEDNLADIELTREALETSKPGSILTVAENGEEALDFLYKRGKHQSANRPDLILLDLNLPRLSGKEVLKIIKSDEKLRQIPIIILTSSRSPSDILDAYNLSANSYITKPSDVNSFIETMASLHNFWFDTACLPK